MDQQNVAMDQNQDVAINANYYTGGKNENAKEKEKETKSPSIVQ